MTNFRNTALITIGAAFAAHFVVSSMNVKSADASSFMSALTVAAPNIDDGTSLPGGLNGHSKLDLAFCIDTTSSMQGEIDTVKNTVKSMVEKLSKRDPQRIIRVGLVAYRDEGDEYVTKVFPFSANIDQVVSDISGLMADGGGDGPESVDCGLHSALTDLKWSNDKGTTKVLFVIGDAPPHDQTKFDWKAEASQAAGRHIRINTISCDGLEGYVDGPTVFKKLANLTNGNFDTLAYHQDVVDASGHHATLITSGGATYRMKSSAKADWKAGVGELMAKGAVTSYGSAAGAPSLQGATNGTIGPQGADATYVTGVNTAGTVRTDNNLESVMLKGAQAAVDYGSK